MRASSAAKKSDMAAPVGSASIKRNCSKRNLPWAAGLGLPFVEIEGKAVRSGGDTVHPLSTAIHHRSRCSSIGLPSYGDFPRALGDQHDLFFGMLMRRVWHHAGLQGKTAHSQSTELPRRTIQVNA